MSEKTQLERARMSYRTLANERGMCGWRTLSHWVARLLAPRLTPDHRQGRHVPSCPNGAWAGRQAKQPAARIPTTPMSVRSGAIVQKPGGPNEYDLKLWL